MNIAIPAIPTGIIVLINFFAPYLVSVLVAQAWTAKTKQLVAAATSLVLTLLVLIIAHFGFGLSLGSNIWLVGLLGVVVLFFSYNTVHKELADALTAAAGIGTTTTTDDAPVLPVTAPVDVEPVPAPTEPDTPAAGVPDEAPSPAADPALAPAQ